MASSIGPPPSNTNRSNNNSGGNSSSSSVNRRLTSNLNPNSTNHPYEYIIKQGLSESSFKDGNISAPNTVSLWQKSSLPSNILSQIWKMTDVDGKGYLKVNEFYDGLKLIALAQEGKTLDLNGTLGWPTPKLDGINPPSAANAASQSSILSIISESESLFSEPQLHISAEDQQKFSQLFDSSHPNQGLLDANSCRQIFLKSNLSNEVLGKLWFLVNPAKAQALSDGQFIVAMYLIGKLVDGTLKTVPSSLNPQLLAISSKSVSQSATTLATTAQPNPKTALVTQNPVSPTHAAILPLISKEDRLKSDNYFITLDRKKTGLLYGTDVAEFFKASNLPGPTLSTIWSLADVSKQGALTRDEFAIAMYYMQKAINGEPLQSPTGATSATISNASIPPISVGNPAILKSPIHMGQASSTILSPQTTLLQPSIVGTGMSKEQISNQMKDLSYKTGLKEAELFDIQNKANASEKELQELMKRKSEVEEQYNSVLADVKAAEEAQVIRQMKIQETRSMLHSLQSSYEQSQTMLSAMQAEKSVIMSQLMKDEAELAELRAKMDLTNKDVEVARSDLVKKQEQMRMNQIEIENMKSLVLRKEAEKESLINASKDIKIEPVPANLNMPAPNQPVAASVLGVPVNQQTPFTTSFMNSKANGPTSTQSTPVKNAEKGFDDLIASFGASVSLPASPAKGLAASKEFLGQSTSSQSEGSGAKKSDSKTDFGIPGSHANADAFSSFFDSTELPNKKIESFSKKETPTKMDAGNAFDPFGINENLRTEKQSTSLSFHSILSDQKAVSDKVIGSLESSQKPSQKDVFGVKESKGSKNSLKDSSVSPSKISFEDSFQNTSLVADDQISISSGKAKGISIEKKESGDLKESSAKDQFDPFGMDNLFTTTISANTPKSKDPFGIDEIKSFETPNKSSDTKSNNNAGWFDFDSVPVAAKSVNTPPKSEPISRSTRTDEKDDLASAFENFDAPFTVVKTISSSQAPTSQKPTGQRQSVIVANFEREDPFANNPFGISTNSPVTKGVTKADTFSSSSKDPFAVTKSNFGGDGAFDPFGESAPKTVSNDPFATSDPFDPFISNASGAGGGSDPFGTNDPFASGSMLEKSSTFVAQSNATAVKKVDSNASLPPVTNPGPKLPSRDPGSSNSPTGKSSRPLPDIASKASDTINNKVSSVVDSNAMSSNISELVSMGFTEQQARDALLNHNNNLVSATNFLLDGGVDGTSSSNRDKGSNWAAF